MFDALLHLWRLAFDVRCSVFVVDSVRFVCSTFFVLLSLFQRRFYYAFVCDAGACANILLAH